MSNHSDPPTRPAPGRRSRAWPWGLALGLTALLAFGLDLAAEPHFADESAYLSQAYFADLWLAGDRDSPRWLEFPAWDLPPLPKYLIGIALRVGGEPRPAPSTAFAWYQNIDYRPESPAMLVAGRWPSVAFGALGCVALYALGTLAADRRTGLLAAGLLMANPLYRTHARRAMSDVPTEALILLSCAVALWAWRRFVLRGGWAVAIVGSLVTGACAGLATLSKLNGGIACLILLAWSGLALLLPRLGRRRFGLPVLAMLAGLVALATFVALNPFLTARPSGPLPPRIAEVANLGVPGRMLWLLRHRFEAPRDQKVHFAEYALNTPVQKLGAVGVQGFGRFGPLGPAKDDSTIRFDWSQDWGATIWGPVVGLGIIGFAIRGARQARSETPPTAWAVLALFGMVLATVTAYIPLAWDRYYLSIQPGAALLGSGAIVAAGDGLARSARRWWGLRTS